jgi:hypothetical protein
MGHECLLGVRDMILIQTIILFFVAENLRGASILIHDYIKYIDERNIQELTISYTNTNDNIAPSYVIFGSIMLRICGKDVRSKPLNEWLIKLFEPNEIDKFLSDKYISTIKNYCTKIGKIYFNIQPPPCIFTEDRKYDVIRYRHGNDDWDIINNSWKTKLTTTSSMQVCNLSLPK